MEQFIQAETAFREVDLMFARQGVQCGIWVENNLSIIAFFDMAHSHSIPAFSPTILLNQVRPVQMDSKGTCLFLPARSEVK